MFGNAILAKTLLENDFSLDIEDNPSNKTSDTKRYSVFFTVGKERFRMITAGLLMTNGARFADEKIETCREFSWTVEKFDRETVASRFPESLGLQGSKKKEAFKEKLIDNIVENNACFIELMIGKIAPMIEELVNTVIRPKNRSWKGKELKPYHRDYRTDKKTNTDIPVNPNVRIKVSIVRASEKRDVGKYAGRVGILYKNGRWNPSFFSLKDYMFRNKKKTEFCTEEDGKRSYFNYTKVTSIGGGSLMLSTVGITLTVSNLGIGVRLELAYAYVAPGIHGGGSESADRAAEESVKDLMDELADLQMSDDEEAPIVDDSQVPAEKESPPVDKKISIPDDPENSTYDD